MPASKEGRLEDLVSVLMEEWPTTFEVSSISMDDLQSARTFELRNIFEEISRIFHDATDPVNDDTLLDRSVRRSNQIERKCTGSKMMKAAFEDVFQEDSEMLVKEYQHDRAGTRDGIFH